MALPRRRPRPRRKPRLPPRAARYNRSPKPPRGAELAYRLALRGLLAVWRDVVRRIALPLAAKVGKPDARTDADDKPLDKLAAAGKALANSPALAKATKGVADKALRNSKAEFKHLGIKIRDAEPGFDKAITAWRKENVALIETLFEKETDKLATILAEGENRRVESLAEEIEDRLGIAQRKAELIARDQTLKLNANINEARQKAAGISRYIWTTAGDERVRPMHQELDGTEQSWDDPPVTNEDGDRNHPGEDYQCRCVAYPILDELDGEPTAAAAPEEQAPEPEPTPEPVAEEKPVDDTEITAEDIAAANAAHAAKAEAEFQKLNAKFLEAHAAPEPPPVVVKEATPKVAGEPIPPAPAPATSLDFAPGAELVEDHDAPEPFSVWLDGDIIGVGKTAQEAIADAKAAMAAEKAAAVVEKVTEPKPPPVFDLAKMQKVAAESAAKAKAAAEVASKEAAVKAAAAAKEQAAKQAKAQAEAKAKAEAIAKETAKAEAKAKAEYESKRGQEVPLVEPKPTVTKLPSKVNADYLYDRADYRKREPARLDHYLERSRYAEEPMFRANASSAVESYTGGGHRDLNLALLGKGQLDYKLQTLTNSLDRYINEAKSSGSTIAGTTYRGMNFARLNGAEQKEFWSEVQVGKVVSNKPFWSTSIAEEVAEQFAGTGHNRVMIEIEGASGVPLGNVSGVPEELEVLYGRNRRFMVKSIEDDKGGKRIRLREVF